MRRILFLIAALSIVACTDSVTSPSLIVERHLDDGPSFNAHLVSYKSAGLTVYAMVAVPMLKMPKKGFPVIIANHGYVPDPPKYGKTSEGVNSRPGDYYRSVPELYTSRGFLVVLPDYRGHNDSEGVEFVHRPASVDLYAEDVLALLTNLHELDGADLDNVFLWSHSMGGAVSVRVQLGTDLFQAASYWAPVSLDDQLHQLGQLRAPIVIHHSSGDESTDYSNSLRLRNALIGLNHPVVLYTYDGSHHYFEGSDGEQAADRDAAFFQAQIR